ncbi:MAG: hypothetical protein ACLFPL_01015 [Candidatus Nanoarchaeia archaeon]
MNLKTAQASFELLLVLGFSLTLTILGAGYYIIYSEAATDDLNSQQIDRVFEDIMSKASRVYYSGNGNRITVEATLPAGVESITIENGTSSSGDSFNYINVTQQQNEISVSSQYFPSDLFIYLNCSISCSPSSSGRYIYDREHTNQGPKDIRIESKGDIIYIDFIN